MPHPTLTDPHGVCGDLVTAALLADRGDRQASPPEVGDLERLRYLGSNDSRKRHQEGDDGHVQRPRQDAKARTPVSAGQLLGRKEGNERQHGDTT